MRVVFMGTPQFAANILDEIARHHDVACVYTQPDKVRSRGKKLVASPVKETALEFGIETRTPASLRSEEEIEYLRELAPDAICVAAYGKILPKEILDIPKHGCLNVHASLLPRWRGAAPIERAILAGDEYAGVCIMRMEEGLDTGDWCISRKIPIGKMRAQHLEEELAELGAKALLSALVQCESGQDIWQKQDDSLSTYAPKLEKRELWLDVGLSAQDAFRRFLASSKSHPSKLKIADVTCTLEDASLIDLSDVADIAQSPDFEKGDLVRSGKRLFLVFDDSAMEVLSLKPDGRQKMDVASFLAGTDIQERSTWSSAQ